MRHLLALIGPLTIVGPLALIGPLLLAGLSLAATGCATVQVGVTNPIPGMTTVAIVPFLNLSAERAVDGRRFALAYQAELQKVPGYQVLPVGVAERAAIDLGLDLGGPDDALRLAKELGVDAVVVGAVTDYNPYYPPRIGLQVSWYSPKAWLFSPGLPLDPRLGDALRKTEIGAVPFGLGRDGVIRAQSPDAGPNPIHLTGVEAAPGPLLVMSPEQNVLPFCPGGCPPPDGSGVWHDCPPPGFGYPVTPDSQLTGGDPIRPVMSYTRIFDGADADLTALLRDYVALSGDLRSGGWEAYLHRSEDFIRFTAHRMIVEMLTLHGGQAKTRYVWRLGGHDHD